MKRTPIKRKRAKRRPNGTGCQARHGNRICRQDAYMEVDGRRCCPKHAADRLFARLIRESGPCHAAGYRFPCGGVMECAHIITRARESIRWSTDNAMPLCSGHHVWFTHNPAAWRLFLADHDIDHDELYRRGYNDPPEDPREVIERLREVA